MMPCLFAYLIHVMTSTHYIVCLLLYMGNKFRFYTNMVLCVSSIGFDLFCF